VTEAKPFHSTAAPRDQGLHLLQTSIFLEILRMKKGGESSQPFRDLRGNDENGAQSG
jgi:hypothetical protein